MALSPVNVPEFHKSPRIPEKGKRKPKANIWERTVLPSILGRV